MTPKDMGKAILVQSGNRDIPGSKCGIKVCTFMHFEVQGRGKYAIYPIGEIGRYVLRENIL